ncbi:hypothetical protein [Nocardioides sp. URHA0020]|uniref:hypothetical protein n=1 Tax=Nocardioides sp. URHA0020 TaxID=1380392 RepID=UPI00048F0369|nr:hypothetical protein [Nocardioides sp. URHA0020]
MTTNDPIVNEFNDLPLFLLSSQDLWDLDTEEASEVAETRQHAYHEAGHTWAAHRAGLPLRSATLAYDNQPYAGVTDHQSAELAALGFLTQGAFVEIEILHEHGYVLDPKDEAEDAQRYFEHVLCVRDGSCCCRRGGDQIADDLLDNVGWIRTQIAPLVRDWDRIDALAHRLMTGDVIEPAEIRALLGSRQASLRRRATLTVWPAGPEAQGTAHSRMGPRTRRTTARARVARCLSHAQHLIGRHAEPDGFTDAGRRCHPGG